MPGATKSSVDDPISVAKKNYRAYVDKDRAAIEQLVTRDFHFSTPLDSRIDRQTYCARCWPNSAYFRDFKLAPPSRQAQRCTTVP